MTFRDILMCVLFFVAGFQIRDSFDKLWWFNQGYSCGWEVAKAYGLWK